ncbi:MAG: hypothetical protein GF416_01950 [Candidatus Altiarchaeales archaeon]|nr:hypothetical protein [Candidatus Altiarchaeales archaeon]MBD3415880.1 hypothetical protein [Candidatus Altiarchaeales archaeon]
MKHHLIAIMLLASVLASHVSAADEEYMGLEWNYSVKEVLSELSVADVTGDEKLEVIASGSSDGSAYVIGSDGELIWRKEVFSYINTVYPVDIDGDGKHEVIAGHSDMTVFDNEGKGWKYRTSNAVHNIRSGDMNGNGRQDIIAVSYDKSSCSKSNFIYAVNGLGKEEIWKYSVGNSEPYSLEVADLDGDGSDEVIVGLIYKVKSSYKPCERSYSHESAVLVLNNEKRLIWQFETIGAAISLAAGDVTGDGRKEVIVGSYPTLYVLDADGGLIWKKSDVINTYVEDVAVADLDGDNRSEVIAASNEVYVFDQEGDLLWKGMTDSRVYSVAAGDLDNDGVPEVIAGSASIYVFDAKGTPLWRSDSHTSYGFIESVDLDGQGYDEIVAGSVKDIFVFRTQDYAKKIRADSLYEQAMLLGGSNPELAVEKLEEAKQLYSQLGLIDRVSECINQITRFSDTTGRLADLRVEAEEALNMSRELLRKGDYMNASKQAQTARYKFSSLNDESYVDQCDMIISETHDVIAYNASQELILANISYHDGEYNLSLAHALNAERYYSFIGEEEYAEKAGVLVSNLSEILGIKHENDTSYNGPELPKLPDLASVLEGLNPVYVILLLIAVVLMAIVFAVGVYVWKMKGRQTLKMDHLHKVSYTQEEDVRMPPENPLRRRPAPARRYTTTAEEEELKVKLPPNKGVFKSSVCRGGVCLKMTRLARK